MESAKREVQKILNLQWRWIRLENMEPILLYDMLALREAIFVVEQTCIYLELDGLDKQAWHLLALKEKQVIACLRVLPPAGQETRTRIGRVAVAPDWRKQGLATVMMDKAVAKAHLEYPSTGVFLDAQTYLKTFYESLGFHVCGSEFLEDGIPHIPMQL